MKRFLYFSFLLIFSCTKNRAATNDGLDTKVEVYLETKKDSDFFAKDADIMDSKMFEETEVSDNIEVESEAETNDTSDFSCTPHEVSCYFGIKKVCKSSGDGYYYESCPAGKVCENGECVSNTGYVYIVVKNNRAWEQEKGSQTSLKNKTAKSAKLATMNFIEEKNPVCAKVIKIDPKTWEESDTEDASPWRVELQKMIIRKLIKDLNNPRIKVALISEAQYESLPGYTVGYPDIYKEYGGLPYLDPFSKYEGYDYEDLPSELKEEYSESQFYYFKNRIFCLNGYYTSVNHDLAFFYINNYYIILLQKKRQIIPIGPFPQLVF